MSYQIISPEETKLLQQSRYGREHPVRTAALQLKPGESFILPKKDWNWKTAKPSAIISTLNRHPHLRFTCRPLADKTGWLITRTDFFGSERAITYIASSVTIKSTKMKLKEILRAYNFSDALLISIIRSLISAARRDLAELGPKGITTEFLNTLEEKNNAFENTPDDEELEGDVTVAVQKKDAIGQDLATRCSEIRSYAKRAFGEESGEYLSFDFEGINEAEEDQREKSYTRVARRALKYKTQLQPKGLTDDELATFTEKTVAYAEARNDVDDAKKDRDIATQQRRIDGNSIFAAGSEISEAGKAYWASRDEAKYNDYVIYNTPGGSAETPPPPAT